MSIIHRYSKAVYTYLKPSSLFLRQLAPSEYKQLVKMYTDLAHPSSVIYIGITAQAQVQLSWAYHDRDHIGYPRDGDALVIDL